MRCVDHNTQQRGELYHADTDKISLCISSLSLKAMHANKGSQVNRMKKRSSLFFFTINDSRKAHQIRFQFKNGLILNLFPQYSKSIQVLLKINNIFLKSKRLTCVNLFDEFLLLLVVKVHVPFCQPGLPCPVLDHDKPDHL